MDLSKKDNDFTEDEANKVNTFVQNGCQGLDVLVADEHKINNMFSLYMSGKNYTEISKITKTKKNLVLYMSAKMNWYEKKMEHINDIQKSMTSKLSNTKTRSLNFIADLINVHHKYYGEKMDEYLRTNDRTIIENLDLKQLSQYFKSIEILEKLLSPANIRNNTGNGTTVNVNAPDGAQVKQLDDKTLEITPGSTGNILEELAKLKDEQKKKS